MRVASWPLNAAAKRVFDVSCSVILLLLLSPVLIVAAAAVRVTMGSPILWQQVRPGKADLPFTIYKFRSMRAPRPGEDWIRSDADRLTTVGRLLRRTSIDELPELWNVMKGDMSLVGPRPLLADYSSRYSSVQRRRNQVRPGITGWAQVNGRQSIPLSKRLELDVWYVDHQSFSLDIKVIVLTAGQVIVGRGVISGQDVGLVDDLSTIATDAPNADEL